MAMTAVTASTQNHSTDDKHFWEH